VIACSDDDAAHLNGNELQERPKDKHRSLSREADRAVLRVGRDSDPEKGARNSRGNDDAARLVRVRPGDGDVVTGDSVWSPQQDEAPHEKLRPREDGSARAERRGRHRTDEPVPKVGFFIFSIHGGICE